MIGILGILWILAVTWFAVHGIDAIAKISSIGGIFVSLLTVIFVLASFTVLIANGGQLAEPIHGLSSFVNSPNSEFQSPMAFISFVVYAVFAYAGAESLGGVTDSMDKPERTFPRGLIIATVVITIATHYQSFCGGSALTGNTF